MSQVIRLQGVLDDGSVNRSPVPLNSAKTIQVPLHTDVTIEVEVTNNAGVPTDLSTPGWTAWFTVVQSPDSCDVAAGKSDYLLQSMTLRAMTRNVIVFAIPGAAFRRFPAGRYFYDVALQLSGRRYGIVRISGLILEQTLRRV